LDGGERREGKTSPRGLDSRGVMFQTLHGPRSNKQRWMDR